jgi:hypothetical protein
MTRQVRSWAIAALAVFALAGAAAPSFAGITYNVTNDLNHQNGWSLAGTITVAGVGTLSTSAITAWDFTASKSGSPSRRYSNSTSTASNPVIIDGTLSATSTTLSLAASSYFNLREGNTAEIIWANEYSSFGSSYLGSWVGFSSLWQEYGATCFSPIVGGAWTLGTVSAVPEIDPATGGSALSLVAGVLAMIDQRRRRATLVA